MLQTDISLFVACCDSCICTIIKSRLPDASQHRVVKTPQEAIDHAQLWGELFEDAVVHIWALDCKPGERKQLSGLRVKSSAQRKLVLRGDSNADGTPRISLGQVQFKGLQPYLVVGYSSFAKNKSKKSDRKLFCCSAVIDLTEQSHAIVMFPPMQLFFGLGSVHQGRVRFVSPSSLSRLLQSKADRNQHCHTCRV